MAEVAEEEGKKELEGENENDDDDYLDYHQNLHHLHPTRPSWMDPLFPNE